MRSNAQELGAVDLEGKHRLFQTHQDIEIRGEFHRNLRFADKLIRSVPQLIADVSEFMSLAAGDILLVGVPENPPTAGPGDRVAIEIDGLGRLENPLVAEEEVAA